MIGYHFGHSLVTQHPRFAHLLHAEREAEIEAMIRRHGLKVFFSVPVHGGHSSTGLSDGRHSADVVSPIHSDRCRLRDRRSLGVFFGLGYAYGDRVTALIRLIRRSEIGLTVAIGVGVGVVVAILLFRRYWRNRIARRAVHWKTEST